ncbi:unnamed protein product [Effrenium voratum]|uniref:Uncharacterized protein n=1 Tax=Effrenium voratum TaxID=2562239 RepID=A0AA36NJH2_9DINO|nr:unnamed protein product [Effrenium voratum]
MELPALHCRARQRGWPLPASPAARRPCESRPRPRHRTAALCAAVAVPGARYRVEERRPRSRAQLVGQLLRLLQGRDILWLVLGSAGLLLSSLAELASPPLAAGALFAAVQGQREVLLPRCLAVAAVALLSGAAEGLRNFAFNMLRSRLVAHVRRSAFFVLMAQELSFFDEVDAAELTSRLSSDCMSVYSYLSDVLSFFLRAGAVTVFSSLALLRISSSITWRVLLLLALLLGCAEWYGQVTRSTGRRTQDALAELGRVSSESLQLLRTVRALGAEDLHRRLFRRQNDAISKTQRQRGVALGVFSATSNGLGVMLQAVTLLVGGGLVLGGSMTGEALATYLLYLDTLVDSALELGIEWSSCNDALGSAERVLGILQTPMVRERGRSPGASRGDVCFDSVHFAYPSRPKRQVLKGVSLKCCAGETTALVGFSGSGKSSLISLLLRFYDLKEGHGSVKFDDVDVQQLDRSWLRCQLGVVAQNPRLFRGTVAENIAWGWPATRKEVHAAAEAALAAEFIEQLPEEWDTKSSVRRVQWNSVEGYDTVCSDEKLLSGGQRQRIALARALLRDPTVLLLDEPTSALDPKSSALVSQALEQAQWSEGRQCRRTMIIVAHDLRLGAVQRADKIVVMGRGEILEQGRHAELLELDGSYRRPQPSSARLEVRTKRCDPRVLTGPLAKGQTKTQRFFLA